MSELTAVRLRELINYDADTGVFTWRIRRGCASAGAVAGCVEGLGYRVIHIDGRMYKAHRLAWLYVTGRWPTLYIDHANGQPGDDRFSNLREADCSQNSQNQKRRVTARNPLRGVYFDQRRQKWQAKIGKDNKKFWLGSFPTAEEAHAAYTKAANELHGPFVRTE